MHCLSELAVERRIFVISHQEDGVAQPLSYVGMSATACRVQKGTVGRPKMSGTRDCQSTHPLHQARPG